jgi:hypothetical protein
MLQALPEAKSYISRKPDFRGNVQIPLADRTNVVKYGPDSITY